MTVPPREGPCRPDLEQHVPKDQPPAQGGATGPGSPRYAGHKGRGSWLGGVGLLMPIYHLTDSLIRGPNEEEGANSSPRCCQHPVSLLCSCSQGSSEPQNSWREALGGWVDCLGGEPLLHLRSREGLQSGVP